MAAKAQKRKQDASSYGSGFDGPGDRFEHKPPSRANTFPHARSKSQDTKFGNTNYAPRSETADFPHNGMSHPFEMLQRNNPDIAMASPSTLTSGLSQTQDSFPASPVDQKEQSFPLADISAVMFPSADPVEYPNQNAAAGAQSYDDILKSLASDPSFPFPTSLNELRVQRAAGAGTFVPPSSTFMFNNGETNDQNQIFEADMQLLGPMPAYMMHGGGFAQGGNSSGNNGGVNTPTDFTSQFLNQAGTHVFTPGGGSNPVNNVNLDQLLSGEEWSNLNQNAGYGSMMQQQNMFGNPTTNVTSNFGSAPASEKGNSARTSTEIHDRSQVGGKNVSFDDMNPGVLGWNLGGYP